MLSRTRIFAAVTLLIGCFTGPAAWAQAQNLEEGKSSSQLFASTCNACHKSPRGLLKSVAPGSLAGFLREHYTTGSEMASQLASFLISNGAGDARQAKQGGTDQADHQGRRSRHAPSEDAAHSLNAPAQDAVERGPDGRRSSRQHQGRPAKPRTDEPSMANEPPKDEPSKTAEPSSAERPKAEGPRDEAPKADSATGEMGAAEHAKPDADGKSKSEAGKIEPPTDHASGSGGASGPASQ